MSSPDNPRLFSLSFIALHEDDDDEDDDEEFSAEFEELEFLYFFVLFHISSGTFCPCEAIEGSSDIFFFLMIFNSPLLSLCCSNSAGYP